MNLFAYGSLMFPEVWERVTGLSRPGISAHLDGYAARRIRDQSYPALTASPGSFTEGILYQEIPPEAMARLDVFEGNFYHRTEVEINLADGTAASAWVYLASQPDNPDILPDPWSAGQFARQHLQTFLRQDPGFTEEGR